MYYMIIYFVFYDVTVLMVVVWCDVLGKTMSMSGLPSSGLSSSVTSLRDQQNGVKKK